MGKTSTDLAESAQFPAIQRAWNILSIQRHIIACLPRAAQVPLLLLSESVFPQALACLYNAITEDVYAKVVKADTPPVRYGPYRNPKECADIRTATPRTVCRCCENPRTTRRQLQETMCPTTLTLR
jgi:hypothetical protein